MLGLDVLPDCPSDGQQVIDLVDRIELLHFIRIQISESDRFKSLLAQIGVVARVQKCAAQIPLQRYGGGFRDPFKRQVVLRLAADEVEQFPVNDRAVCTAADRPAIEVLVDGHCVHQVAGDRGDIADKICLRVEGRRAQTLSLAGTNRNQQQIFLACLPTESIWLLRCHAIKQK